MHLDHFAQVFLSTLTPMRHVNNAGVKRHAMDAAPIQDVLRLL